MSTDLDATSATTSGDRPASVPAPPAAPAAPPPAGPGWLSGLSLGRVLALLAAAVVGLPTFIAASNALLDTVYGLKPEWRPDGPPAAIGVTLSEVALEERRIEDENGGLGNLISYDVELIGYRGNKVPVEWAAFDAQSLQRVSISPGKSPAENIGIGAVITEAASDRISANFPIPIPTRAMCIFIRVYVFEDDASHTRQDYRDSAPFDTHDPGNRACASQPD